MIDIPNYNGKYQIDELGNVYSKPKGRLLKATNSVRGYMVLNLNKKTRTLHQLVIESFVDSNYKSKGLVIDHINRDKTDNSLMNLRLVTKSENFINSDYYEKRKRGHIYIKDSGNYNAIITVKGVRFDKTFKTEKEAKEYITGKSSTKCFYVEDEIK